MNLIEQLGGYKNSKGIREAYLKNGWSISDVCKGFHVAFTVKDLDCALLEHRRENNIFEVGDKVVFSNKCALNHSIWQVIKNDGNIVVAPICNHNGRVVVESNTPVQHPYSIQHATDEEIKAGHRL